jgi:4-carboxymuconolactone decarboxylase
MTDTGKSRAQELLGDTAPELAAAMTHLAFYAGWPAGMTGATKLKKITEE